MAPERRRGFFLDPPAAALYEGQYPPGAPRRNAEGWQSGLMRRS